MAKASSQVTTLGDQESNDSTSAPEVVEKRVIKGANHDTELSGERRTVTIHPTDAEGGSDAVFVSLNGYAYQIPRAIPVDIPVEVFEIIKNAKTTMYTATEGGGVRERQVQRYAFTAE